MKTLILMHKDLVPPEEVNEKEVDWEKIPWMTEYDVITHLKKFGHNIKVLGVISDLTKIRTAIKEFKPKIVFNLLEEFNGEAVFDQNVVSYLELLKMPYTGCNPRGLILARDKSLSKKILTYHRIRTPKFQVFPCNQHQKKLRLNSFPLIVKCLNEESSLGISQASVVHNEEKLLERVQFIHKNFFTDAIVEEFIEGTECYVGVIGNYRLKALPVWQLFFKETENPEKEFYTTNAKHSPKYRERRGVETGPAKLDEALIKEMQKVAKKTFRALNLNGYARIDMRVTAEGRIYIIEANPNPDISEFDDFAQSALAAGIKYPTLLNKLLKLGRLWSPTTSFYHV